MMQAARQDRAWATRLAATLERNVPSCGVPFEPDVVADLSDPIRRYFEHAIAPGTPLAQVATLSMHGRIRLAPRLPWLPFRARQVLAVPTGFIWEPTVGRGLFQVVGADTYLNGCGRVAFRLWDRVPLVRGSGLDVSRSARGRLAIESLWNPASLLHQDAQSWRVLDARTFQAAVTIDEETIPVTFTTGPEGGLMAAQMRRWGNLTADGHHDHLPFGADVLDERTFGGYTIPSQLRVAWWYGTARRFDFFEATLTSATFRPASASPHRPGVCGQ